MLPAQDSTVGGGDRQTVQTRARDDLAIGRVSVKGFGQPVTLLSDLMGDRIGIGSKIAEGVNDPVSQRDVKDDLAAEDETG